MPKNNSYERKEKNKQSRSLDHLLQTQLIINQMEAWYIIFFKLKKLEIFKKKYC